MSTKNGLPVGVKAVASGKYSVERSCGGARRTIGTYSDIAEAAAAYQKASAMQKGQFLAAYPIVPRRQPYARSVAYRQESIEIEERMGRRLGDCPVSWKPLHSMLYLAITGQQLAYLVYVT